MGEAFRVSQDAEYFTNQCRSIFSILQMPWFGGFVLFVVFFPKAKKFCLEELPKFDTYFFTSEKKKKACAGFLSNGIQNFFSVSLVSQLLSELSGELKNVHVVWCARLASSAAAIAFSCNI